MPKTHVVYPVKFQVVIGSITTGFHFWGPFNLRIEAGRWALANLTSKEIKTYVIEPINTIPEDWG